MRALIYLEAYPLRNKLTSHLWLVGELKNLIDQSAVPDAEIRIFCSDIAFEKFAKDEPNCVASLIRFTPELEQEFLNRTSIWEIPKNDDDVPGGVRNWINYVQGRDETLNAVLYRDLKAIYKGYFQFDTVVYWGANQSLSNEALAKVLPGVVSIAMELGPTRYPFEPTLAVDTFGVNGISSFARLTTRELLSLRQLQPTQLRTQNAVLMQGGRTLFQSRPSVLSNALGEYLISLRRDVDRLVLFPNQLADDANSLIYANGLDSFSAIEKVCSHPAMTNGLVVVKPHPKSLDSTYNASVWKETVLKINENLKGRAIVLPLEVSQAEYVAFLEFFDAVIGINSSVIFEAALLDRPVAALGLTGFFPSDAASWIDAALNDWSGEPAEAAKVAVGLALSYLLPRRSIFKDRDAFLSVVEGFAVNRKETPIATLRAIAQWRRKNTPRENSMVHWTGPYEFKKSMWSFVPKSGTVVNVITNRTGFEHPRFAVTIEEDPSPDSLTGEVEGFEVKDGTLSIRVFALTDFGGEPAIFCVKSGGRVMFFRVEEERPTRARLQGFSKSLKIGSTLKLPLQSEEFPLYASLKIYAIAADARATELSMPPDLPQLLHKSILRETGVAEPVPADVSN